MSDKNEDRRVEKHSVLKRLGFALLMVGVFTIYLESAQAATPWWNTVTKSPHFFLRQVLGRGNTGMRELNNGSSNWRRRSVQQRKQFLSDFTEVAATSSRSTGRTEIGHTMDSSISPRIRNLNTSYAKDPHLTT